MTREEYDKGLAQVRRRSPKHPLLSVLAGGCSDVNAMYLEHILGELEKEDDASMSVFSANAGKTDIEGGAAPKNLAADPLHKKLMLEKSGLFVERAKLSNRFHDCDTDEQRAYLSDEIQAVQAQIERVKRQIREYEQGGKLPGADEGFQVPGDPHEQHRALNSLRASASRFKRELELAVINPQRNKRRIEELEAKLREKKNQIELVTKAIKQGGGSEQG